MSSHFVPVASAGPLLTSAEFLLRVVEPTGTIRLAGSLSSQRTCLLLVPDHSLSFPMFYVQSEFRGVLVLTLFTSLCGDLIGLCKAAGGREVNLTLTAYYPDTFSDDESGMMDMRGNRLRTLQDYLDGRAPYVTVSTDARLEIPYGTRVLIPDLDHHFCAKDGIRFEARDTGAHMDGAGFSRLDVCVRSEQDSYDVAVNRDVKAVFLLD